jgi:hypothetical protein
MGVSETLQEQSMTLVGDGTDEETAVQTLIQSAMGRRVAVVRAKQELEARAEAGSGDSVAAVGLLQQVLARGSWT